MLLAMRRDPALWLLVAILAVHGAVILTHYRHPLITDEFYYVAKARYLAEHHRFAPIDPHALAAERGTEWGNSDWRPPGYPLLLAAISGGDFSDPAGALRFRVTAAQFAMVAAALLALYRAAVQAGVDGRARYAAALLLAVPPWTFGAVNEIGPDPENLALVTFGLLALGRNRIALGALLLSLTFFFRPEMIVLPPIMVGVALLFGAGEGRFLQDGAPHPPLRGTFSPQAGRRTIAAAVKGPSPRLRGEGGALAPGEGRCLPSGAPHPPLRGTFSPRAGRRTIGLVVAAAIYLLLVGAQVAYRTSLTGSVGVFGGLHIYNRGAFDWANSWLGTEKETYDFVYLLGDQTLYVRGVAYGGSLDAAPWYLRCDWRASTDA